VEVEHITDSGQVQMLFQQQEAGFGPTGLFRLLGNLATYWVA
jgi:hypothetical protein